MISSTFSSLVLSAILLSKCVNAAFPDCVNGPLKDNTVCDSNASTLARATALINLFTLEEMINNTQNTSPGVPRLGLPPYQWWQEALHGVASSPGVTFANSGDFSYATSFPSPILLGATFDDALIKDMATVISTEGRAFNNFNRSGLDFWTPNINPFRDPRWGRGQETPGEDPFHLSSYVYNLITGLQGGLDPEYKKVVATCKHFAAYDIEDWQGNARYGFDAQVPLQDLVEYFLPPFQSCARDANVGAVMCSYNALNGIPTCADSYLLQTILREHWGWTKEDQWVTSDCDAIGNIYDPHNYTSTLAEAVADALNAGSDLDCGTTYPDNLGAAYSQGLFNQSTLSRALVRQYSSLVKLGYFDPAEAQPYRSLAWEDVGTAEAQQLAYTAAVEGITLLKNDGVLPFSPSVKKIALVGPWANATTQMQGNYNGIAPFLHSPLYAAQHLNISVAYTAGPAINATNTDSFPSVLGIAGASDIDVIVYAGGIDNTIEAEAMDRTTISWPGVQLQLISSLAALGKPTVVLQMGGGQVDDSSLLSNSNVSAIIWGGYPGQDGGTAIFDIITGKQAPAGRLPVTQYPANYVDEVPMTNMTLRAGPGNPGRTYKWYTGTPVFEFGFGLHYTTFSSVFTGSKALANQDIAQLVNNCHGVDHIDLCPFTSFDVEVKNTGNMTSDYVVLLFLSGNFGPQPSPIKSLVSYDRLHGVEPLKSQQASLELTLGSLARVDENGNTVLYPGNYKAVVDIDAKTEIEFTLTGEQHTLDEWPKPQA